MLHYLALYRLCYDKQSGFLLKLLQYEDYIFWTHWLARKWRLYLEEPDFYLGLISWKYDGIKFIINAVWFHWMSWTNLLLFCMKPLLLSDEGDKDNINVIKTQCSCSTLFVIIHLALGLWQLVCSSSHRFDWLTSTHLVWRLGMNWICI